MTGTGTTLLEGYDGLVCDLDGVVHRGGHALPGAVSALTSARTQNRAIVYATNNASRPPAVVAEHLRALGLTLSDQDVVNSAMAGAREILRMLRDRDARPGRTTRKHPVLAVGGPGVADALEAGGLRPVHPQQARDGAPVRAVLQGYGEEVTASDLAEVAFAVQAGACWVATNADSTLPTDRGLAPGNGSLVAAVRAATATDPFVAGKPGPPLYALSLATLGVTRDRALALGDRLDTDIAGAHAAGLDAALVLTGVHGVTDLILSEPSLRPRYLLTSLTELNEPYAVPHHRGPRTVSCGQAVVALEAPAGRADGAVRIVQSGPPGDVLRAAVALLGAALDRGALDPESAARLSRSLPTPSP